MITAVWLLNVITGRSHQRSGTKERVPEDLQCFHIDTERVKEPNLNEEAKVEPCLLEITLNTTNLKQKM